MRYNNVIHSSPVSNVSLIFSLVVIEVSCHRIYEVGTLALVGWAVTFGLVEEAWPSQPGIFAVPNVTVQYARFAICRYMCMLADICGTVLDSVKVSDS